MIPHAHFTQHDNETVLSTGGNLLAAVERVCVSITRTQTNQRTIQSQGVQQTCAHVDVC